MTDITLYGRAWCSWCIDAKEYLTERGYQFTEIDVGRDRDAYEEMRELSAGFIGQRPTDKRKKRRR